MRINMELWLQSPGQRQLSLMKQLWVVWSLHLHSCYQNKYTQRIQGVSQQYCALEPDDQLLGTHFILFTFHGKKGSEQKHPWPKLCDCFTALGHGVMIILLIAHTQQHISLTALLVLQVVQRTGQGEEEETWGQVAQMREGQNKLLRTISW